MPELLWYTLAATLAGVGTGLMGLSAATAASLWSARFVNRVNNRTAGLVTGVILTAMGALLLIPASPVMLSI